MERAAGNLLADSIHASASNSVLAFVVSAYLAVLLLFWVLQLYVWGAPNSARRKQLKAVIWSLAAFLTGMLSYKVAALMPGPVSYLVVWGMTAAMIIGGFNDFVINP